MANYLLTTLVPLLRPYQPVFPILDASLDPNNMLLNSLLTAGSPTPTSWTVGNTVTAGFTEQLVATDTDFTGKCWEWNLTNPNISGFRQLWQQPAGSTWSVGDTIVFCAREKVVTNNANTLATNGAGVRILATCYSGSPGQIQLFNGDDSVHAVGDIYQTFVVPPGTTTLEYDIFVNLVPTNGQLTVRVGHLGAFNLTRMGLV
jgi:hypothetical protein